MRVLVIGAAGGIGRRLSRLLVDQGVEVLGMYRGEGQDAVIRDAGATPVPGDLIDDAVATLAERMAGCDAVVFSAGAHGTGADKTTAIDGRGLEKTADAALLAGVRRVVLVSVFLDAGRDRPRAEGFEHYMAVKRASDVYLAATDLDWLIVRPGTLRDTPGTGQVSAGVAIAYGDVARDDVAAFIATVLFRPDLNRAAIGAHRRRDDDRASGHGSRTATPAVLNPTVHRSKYSSLRRSCASAFRMVCCSQFDHAE